MKSEFKGKCKLHTEIQQFSQQNLSAGHHHDRMVQLLEKKKTSLHCTMYNT
jgi:hypothetical protein